jgi:hypothetical protein
MLTAHEARDQALAHGEHNEQLNNALKAISEAADQGLFSVTITGVGPRTQDALMALGYDVTTLTGKSHSTIVWY